MSPSDEIIQSTDPTTPSPSNAAATIADATPAVADATVVTDTAADATATVAIEDAPTAADAVTVNIAAPQVNLAAPGGANIQTAAAVVQPSPVETLDLGQALKPVISGSTLSPEGRLAVMEAHFAELLKTVKAHVATVEKALGEELLDEKNHVKTIEAQIVHFGEHLAEVAKAAYVRVEHGVSDFIHKYVHGISSSGDAPALTGETVSAEVAPTSAQPDPLVDINHVQV